MLPGSSRRKRGIAALAFLLSALCLISAAQTGETSGSKVVRGVVVNSVTRDPIPRALVSSGDNRYATLTDEQGRFEFTAPASEPAVPDSANPTGTVSSTTSISTSAGDGTSVTETVTQTSGSVALQGLYALQARKPGFLPDGREPVVQVGTGNDLVIPLVPEARIVGHVTLPSSEPPDRIAVELYRKAVQDGRPHWIRAGQTGTRSDGEFRFADLPAGTYKVFTSELLDRDPETFIPGGQLYGYAPIYFPNVVDFSSASEIRVGAGQTFEANMTLVRQPYYNVSVPVLGVEPGVSLNVVVSVEGRRGPGYSLGYDPEQHAVTGMLPNGTYHVDAVGYETGVSASADITIHGGPAAGPAMTVVPARSILVNMRQEFTHQRSSEAAGSGGADRDRLDQSFNVTLEPAEDFGAEGLGGHFGEVRRAGNQLQIQSVFPGRYRVKVSTGYGYVASVTSGDTDLLREPFVVGTGGTSPPIEVTLRDDAARVDGSVENVSPQPNSQSPAYVYLLPLPDGDGDFRELSVSPDGTFTLPGVVPGSYRVLAFREPHQDLEFRDADAMQTYEGKGPVIHLSAGEKEQVRVPLSSASE